MKIFFDTEFIEDGKTIELISIGAVREDGVAFYAENAECDLARACDWVKANVLPHLQGGGVQLPRRDIAIAFQAFAGSAPEFWAYYADYDWVAICQLYGRMVDLPPGWPKFCMDLKQLAVMTSQKILTPNPNKHDALADARWNMQVYDALTRNRGQHDQPRP